ncbi:MAG: disulfide bond formation protein B [Alphaproteobacteria bacterium]|nr:disulfide bond formation protein B [Alphaproteobacteria bacterium]
MKCPMKDPLPMPNAAILLLTASVVTLLFAFVMQYGFGYEPCVLCLWQRIPFAVTALLAAIVWGWRPYEKQTTLLLGLCALAYLAGMGLGIFHTGVEQHWWLGTSGCAVNPLQARSVEDLREALLHITAVPCDKVQWRFLGLSMANWNVPFSLALALFSAAAAAKTAQN